ncbi:DNA gyrase subunit A [Paeniglutamicibacter psychrophenolicus]|uniref:DNA gyrase subunit A n=1 Tax=Paeniglutamicibacter psychrophenolicus TaxID=257454 RepID=UPI00277DB770|nr:DNA gyrase subunit A [Paeniglutamicibacter psychrophenolicus]MDQ0095143.1 DNA gyrase subunit A [Paeniglutamicibacter psychrophenolicus]
MEQDPQDKTRAELHILEAMVQAFERREEVFSAIEAAQTQDEARTAVVNLLGMDEIQTRAVLDMQARRWTQGEQLKITEHIAVLRAELEPT